MTISEAVLAALAVVVAALLARGAKPVVGFLLLGSSLFASAILFMPTSLLSEWLGMDRVHRLYRFFRPTPLNFSEWIHVAVFAWLGLLVVSARRELRNWRGIVLMGLAGVAAELSQLLTEGRQIQIQDAVLNALGGTLGAIIALGCCTVLRWRSGTQGTGADDD